MSLTNDSDPQNDLMQAITGLSGELDIRMPAGHVALALQAFQVSSVQTSASDRTDYYYLKATLSLNFGGDVADPAGSTGGNKLTGYVLTLSLADPLCVPPDHGGSTPAKSVGSIMLVGSQFPQTTQLGETSEVSVSTQISGSIGFFGEIPTAEIGSSDTFGASFSVTRPGITFQNQTHQKGLDERSAQWACTYVDPGIYRAENDFEHAALWQERIPAALAKYYEEQRENPTVPGADSVVVEVGIKLLFEVTGYPIPDGSGGAIMVADFTDGLIFSAQGGHHTARPGVTGDDQRFVPSEIQSSNPAVFEIAHLATWLDGVSSAPPYSLIVNLGGINAKIPKPPAPQVDLIHA